MDHRKSIFISGGGSGIGRATAQHFARRGWFVGLGDIDAKGMGATRDLVGADQCSAHILDVRDRAAWEAALAAFAEASGGAVDVVMNNAGIAHGGPFIDQTEDEVDRQIAINLKGVINGGQAAYPYLLASAPGSCLLNTASAAALYGTAGMAVYSATKFAVRALTEALDIEWQQAGIKVRSIMPGFIDTPLLHGPAGANAPVGKRDAVLAARLEFTPVEQVAEAAWEAVHGARLHSLVGKTARKLAHAAKWTPGAVRKKMKGLMMDPVRA